MLTKTCLHKGNVLRIISCDDHVINIKKEKSTTTRGSVNKERRIMSTGRKASSSDHRGKTLKPSTRSLLEAIKRAAKTTNHTLRDRIPRWRLHIHFLTEFTVKKGILHIKLRYRPLTNRNHSKKSANRGHMSHRCKSLIIVQPCSC